MAGNRLCGLDREGDGTYTAEGITKLCEGLKGSAVTSLECAAAPLFAFVSAPVVTLPTFPCWQLGQQPALRPLPVLV